VGTLLIFAVFTIALQLQYMYLNIVTAGKMKARIQSIQRLSSLCLNG